MNVHSPKWAYLMMFYGLLMVISIVLAIVQSIAYLMHLIDTTTLGISLIIAIAVNLSGLILNYHLEKALKRNIA